MKGYLMDGSIFMYLFIIIVFVLLGLRNRFLLVRQKDQFEHREKQAMEALRLKLGEYASANTSLDLADLLDFIDIPTLFDNKTGSPKKSSGKNTRQ